MIIKIAIDFSDTPGARYYTDGDNSGQEFYEKLLVNKFRESLANKEILEIDFDDCYGFPSSFLSESFGRLSVEFGKDVVLKNLKLTSVQDPLIPEQIASIITDPKRKINEK